MAAMSDERQAISVSRLPRLVGRGLVRLYRYTLSPLIGPRCRHLPTCSDYAEQAINRFGLWAGAWLALARIIRCHPFGTAGLDFVPIVWEHFDLVVRQRDYSHEPVQAVVRFLASKEFAARAQELGGYDISAAGAVRFAR